MDGGGSAHGLEAVDRGVGVGAGRDSGEGKARSHGSRDGVGAKVDALMRSAQG